MTGTARGQLSPIQRDLMRKVIRHWQVTGAYYRAQTSGERATLASLWRVRLLERRAWKGKPPYEANEYCPAPSFGLAQGGTP